MEIKAASTKRGSVPPIVTCGGLAGSPSRSGEGGIGEGARVVSYREGTRFHTIQS
jgi:hypothetical protein